MVCPLCAPLVGRYAMRFYEEWDPVVRAREGEEEVEFSEEEWELERLEKLKEEQEAEVDEDDEPHFFESKGPWDRHRGMRAAAEGASWERGWT